MILYVHMKHTAGTPGENRLSNAALSPYYGQRAEFHRNLPDDEIKHLFVTESTSVSLMVSEIQRTATNERSIWRLMLNCHGLPGFIDLAAGVTTDNVREFRNLRNFMTPGGSGVLVGCCFAAASGQAGRTGRGCVRHESSRTNGLTLLQNLARHTGVQVVGGLDEQITWNLNGPILTVLPNGNVSVRMGREVESIRSHQASYTNQCE